jgi:hypothetical protein
MGSAGRNHITLRSDNRAYAPIAVGVRLLPDPLIGEVIWACEQRIYDLRHGQTADLLKTSFLRKESPDLALAVFSGQIDMRMALQHSIFTIHGRATPLEAAERSEGFLAKLIIPESAKLGTQGFRDRAGTLEHTVFPELHHLGNSLHEIEHRIQATSRRRAAEQGSGATDEEDSAK